MRHAYWANIRIRFFFVGIVPARAEHFRLGVEFSVYFQTDGYFVFVGHG